MNINPNSGVHGLLFFLNLIWISSWSPNYASILEIQNKALWVILYEGLNQASPEGNATSAFGLCESLNSCSFKLLEVGFSAIKGSFTKGKETGVLIIWAIGLFLSEHWNHLKGLLQHRFLGPILRLNSCILKLEFLISLDYCWWLDWFWAPLT